MRSDKTAGRLDELLAVRSALVLDRLVETREQRHCRWKRRRWRWRRDQDQSLIRCSGLTGRGYEQHDRLADGSGCRRIRWLVQGLLQCVRRQFVALIVFRLFYNVAMVSCRGLLNGLYFTTTTSTAAPEEVVLHFSHCLVSDLLLLLLMLVLLLLLLLLVLAVFEVGQRILLGYRLWPEQVLGRVRRRFGLVRVLHILWVRRPAQGRMIGRKNKPIREPSSWGLNGRSKNGRNSRLQPFGVIIRIALPRSVVSPYVVYPSSRAARCQRSRCPKTYLKPKPSLMSSEFFFNAILYAARAIIAVVVTSSKHKIN